MLSFFGVLAVALLHVLAGKLHRGAKVRPLWMSVAGGISIAYVFVHLLPDLSEAQARWLEATPHRLLGWFRSQVYIAALVGLLFAFGLDRVTEKPQLRHQRFWIHISSFAIYNLLIGGFALRLTKVVPLTFAVLAFGAHFLVNDHSLHVSYGRDYERVGRWVLAASILLGWLVAQVWQPPVTVVATLLALVAGGMILNVINEELPQKREGRFGAFATGALVYAVLLLLLARIQLAG